MADKYQYCVIMRKAPKTTFTVNTSPADAAVLINGVARRSIEVNSGDAIDINITKNGYKTIDANVIVKRTSSYTFTLENTCKAKVLIENTTADTITINSQTFSNTKIAELIVTPNTNVTVSATKAGYTTATKTITNITKDTTVGIVLVKNANN